MARVQKLSRLKDVLQITAKILQHSKLIKQMGSIYRQNIILYVISYESEESATKFDVPWEWLYSKKYIII